MASAWDALDGYQPLGSGHTGRTYIKSCLCVHHQQLWIVEDNGCLSPLLHTFIGVIAIAIPRQLHIHFLPCPLKYLLHVPCNSARILPSISKANLGIRCKETYTLNFPLWPSHALSLESSEEEKGSLFLA
jgi:hypothetical protein